VDVEAGRQIQQQVLGDDDALGPAAVAEDPEVSVAGLGAAGDVAAAALGARPAVDGRLDEHRPSAGGVSGELVAVDETTHPRGREHDVGTTDTCGSHRDQDAVTLGLQDVDGPDPVVVDDCSHRGDPLTGSGRSGTARPRWTCRRPPGAPRR
jgi:hypothetical protein